MKSICNSLQAKNSGPYYKRSFILHPPPLIGHSMAENQSGVIFYIYSEQHQKFPWEKTYPYGHHWKWISSQDLNISNTSRLMNRSSVFACIDQKTWSEANVFCRSANMQLVSIETQREQQLLHKLVSPIGKELLWCNYEKNIKIFMFNVNIIKNEILLLKSW